MVKAEKTVLSPARTPSPPTPSQELIEGLRKASQQLPSELSGRLNVSRDVLGSAFRGLSVWKVMSRLLRNHFTEMHSGSHKQYCVDALSGASPRPADREELFLGTKLAFLGYSVPYFMPVAATRFLYKNHYFVQQMQSHVAGASLAAFEHMDRVLSGEEAFVTMPDDAVVSGFALRTPIQVWNDRGRPVYHLPPWERRHELLQRVVVGNVNVNVLRQNLTREQGFELYVCLRGTSNEFNAIPQYGHGYRNTPLFQGPQYDMLHDRFVDPAKGEESQPLFYYYYAQQVMQVWPGLEAALTWLGANASHCRRIVIAGHSMGGALALTLGFWLYHRKRAWWDKAQLRVVASPACCNEAAVVAMEQWCIDSQQRNKLVECVNTDDFVNLQYLLGGAKGVRGSVEEGTSALVTWLLQHYWSSAATPPQEKDTDTLGRLIRIVQQHPEVAVSAFVVGAIENQQDTTLHLREAGSRVGRRKAEMRLWGRPLLRQVFQDTVRLYVCRRRVSDWQQEYLGKSHGHYMDLDFNTLWSSLRQYEDRLYRKYARHGLRRACNQWRVVAMFPEQDRERALKLVSTFRPPRFSVSRATARRIVRLQAPAPEANAAKA